MMPELLDHQMLETALGADALAARPHLFSAARVGISTTEYAAMDDFVRAVSHLVLQPAYQKAVAERAGQVWVPQPPSVCLGFDFHRTAAAPQLIEINTNAGGSLLVSLLNRAWQQHNLADQVEQQLVAQFQQVWKAWGRQTSLQTMALVDETPAQQYLYPEFIRWQTLLEAAGIRTFICPPEALSVTEFGVLSYQGIKIDLLYNRLTDFSLTDAATASVACAWQCQAAGLTTGTLITPNPADHAIWADKRNLAGLSDAAQLAAWGLSECEIRCITAMVPRTEAVVAQTESEVSDLWVRRKGLFFKPEAGYGSRATYRGDKLTKRVFDEILQGGYVAQTLVPPPGCDLPAAADGTALSLKYDLRAYVFNGQIQLLAARLYQGQTTNFRTPGGGFAPVYITY